MTHTRRPRRTSCGNVRATVQETTTHVPDGKLNMTPIRGRSRHSFHQVENVLAHRV